MCSYCDSQFGYRSGKTRKPKAVMVGSIVSQSALVQDLVAVGGGVATNWGFTLATRQEANKFLFTCAINYQMPVSQVWEKAEAFIDGSLGSPEDLWGVIGAHTEDAWVARCRVKSFHRFNHAYRRLHRLATPMLVGYGGDARRLWASGDTGETLKNLLAMNFGGQLSRMVVGALRDMQQVSGYADVKADLHVRRVVGRLLDGTGATEARATELTRAMAADPWTLDVGLFQLGQRYCKPGRPDCGQCPVRRHCTYANQ